MILIFCYTLLNSKLLLYGALRKQFTELKDCSLIECCVDCSKTDIYVLTLCSFAIKQTEVLILIFYAVLLHFSTKMNLSALLDFPTILHE